MGKKSKKIAKLTDEEYVAYIAGLKDSAALYTPDGKLIVPDNFADSDKKEQN